MLYSKWAHREENVWIMNSRQATDTRGSMVAEWRLVLLCFFPSCFMVPLVDILSTRGTFFGKTWYWQLAHHGKEWDVPRECSVSARSSVNFISLGLGGSSLIVLRLSIQFSLHHCCLLQAWLFYVLLAFLVAICSRSFLTQPIPSIPCIS